MDMMYKKRAGTSGISGQLYETKLLSLILFRLLHDYNVEEFHLASNMDEIGAFDDICFRIKIKNLTRPLLVFVQAKHKDKEDKYLTLDNRSDLAKWANSIIKIKQRFNSIKRPDKMFSSKFDETEYVFILYTNAKYNVDTNNKYESPYATKLNNFIATGVTVGSRPLYTEKDVNDIGAAILYEDITILAERFAKYINEKPHRSMHIMNDEYILRYHVILAQEVVDVSEIQFEEQTADFKWRLLKFRYEFFDTSEKYLKFFKKQLYAQIIKNYAKKKDDIKYERSGDTLMINTMVEEQIATFLSKPSAFTLSPLIDTYITFNHGKLDFISRRSQSEIQLLKQLNISQLTIDEAKEIAAKNILLSLNLKVPIAFGNIDIAIRGNPKKVKRRTNHLANIIGELCQRSKHVDPYKIITIDNTIDEGVVSPNGGLGGAIGNILVCNENTNLLQFTDDDTSLQPNAKSIYIKLKNKIKNLHEYRFEVKTITLPKLSFDCTLMAKELLSRLIIYAQQNNHCEVEETLKREILEYCSINLHNCSVKADTIFANYHHEILKWWMTSKTTPYLTKTNNIFQQVMSNIIIEPQMTILKNKFYINEMKMIKYKFSDQALTIFKMLEKLSRFVITTEILTLTIMKVIQCLRNKYNNKYAVLDLVSIIDLSIKDFTALNKELENTDKLLIIVWNNLKSTRTSFIRLTEIAEVTKEKNVIIITKNVFLKTIQEYFPFEDIFLDEKQKLTDFTAASQVNIIKNTKVIFQGQNVSLDLLLDSTSIEFIKGAVLNKILDNETLTIGNELSNSNYEDIKHLYINRRVSQNPYKYFEYDDFYSEDKYEEYVPINLIRTFLDINENTVLITAKPGMGKTTLLTHLSLKTKEIDRKFWIIKINLLDHAKDFYKWQSHETIIDTLTTLKFICRIVLKNNDITIDLEETDNKVYLKNSTWNEWASFELELFLHFYNKRQLVFAFDGFDEICPHYRDSVIKFIDVVKNYPQQNKMWVTSRTYTEVLPDLERILGKSYGIEYFNNTEQEIYLKKLFQTNLKLQTFCEVKLNNINSFINFMFTRKTCPSLGNTLLNRFHKVFRQFYIHIYSHFSCDFDKTIGKVKLSAASQNISVKRVDKFMGTPLLLYLFADYFMNLICDSKNTNDWELHVNTLTIYEMFIETKLKKILFECKNKMDVYNPNIIALYEKERIDSLIMHKKIAAYHLLGNPIYSYIFNFDEFKDMGPFNEEQEFINIMNIIKNGSEKTGLISHVVPDNVPVFIHKTFEEYFAAEFICDIFKSDKFDMGKKRLLYTILDCYNHFNLFDWISGKRETDRHLNCILEGIENTQQLVELWRSQLFTSENWTTEQFVRLMSSSPEDYDNDCFNEYNYDNFISSLNSSRPEDRYKHIRKTRDKIIASMKPYLKKYFKIPVEVHPAHHGTIVGAALYSAYY